MHSSDQNGIGIDKFLDVFSDFFVDIPSHWQVIVHLKCHNTTSSNKPQLTPEKLNVESETSSSSFQPFQ